MSDGVYDGDLNGPKNRGYFGTGNPEPGGACATCGGMLFIGLFHACPTGLRSFMPATTPTTDLELRMRIADLETQLRHADAVNQELMKRIGHTIVLEMQSERLNNALHGMLELFGNYGFADESPCERDKEIIQIAQAVVAGTTPEPTDLSKLQQQSEKDRQTIAELRLGIEHFKAVRTEKNAEITALREQLAIFTVHCDEEFRLSAEDLHRIINSCGSANDLSDCVKDLLLAHYMLEGEAKLKGELSEARAEIQRLHDDIQSQWTAPRDAEVTRLREALQQIAGVNRDNDDAWIITYEDEPDSKLMAKRALQAEAALQPSKEGE